MIGQTLGHYRILERLGAGGMGVVYRAHDTILERPAAVKVIEERSATDEAARARLLREARMASALNHANICTVYEVGVAGPPDAPQTYIATARAHSVLAFVYFYQGRKDLIPEEARKAIALDPNERDGYMQMGFYHVLNGEYEEAQALFTKVLDADPLFVPARANFAENLRLMGDTNGAIKEHEKIRDQDPRNVFFSPYLALAYMTAGDMGRARQTLEQALAQQPQNYLFRLLWALELAVEGKRDEALRAMDQGVLQYAELVMNALFAAEFYAVLGDKPAALDWLDRDVRAGDERADWFARDPLLANIREEPRFRQILDSIGSRRKGRAPASR